MKVEKKHLIIGAVAIFSLATVYTLGSLIKDIKSKEEMKNKYTKMINENSNTFNEKDEEAYNNYSGKDALKGLDEDNKVTEKDIVIEEDFKTSIGTGSTDEEIRYNNNLLSDSNIAIKERIKAKNVAENFVQAIVSFNIEKPKETVDKATKYVVKSKKEEIESLYIYLGKNKDIKKTIIDKIYSEEVENKDDNDYILFEVSVDWSVIDKYDQKVNGNYETYEVKLLKQDGEYKAVEYRID